MKVGDRVKFLNEVGEGKVLEIVGDQVRVEDSDGFDTLYHKSDLIAVGGEKEEAEMYGNKLPDLKDIISRDISEERQKAIEKSFELKYEKARSSGSKSGEEMVIDLHFHELVDDITGLNDKAKLDIQLNHFERMMTIAGEQRIRKVIFIHGVGQGVLRHQIRSRLDMYYPNCSVRDANPREYGSGATEVYISQSSF
jgi:hypothetical protein